MPKLTIGQKAQRAVRFLMGMRTPGVIPALAPYGFKEEDLRRGVERLAAVTRARLKPVATLQDPKLVAQLDEFQNRWFQIARVTLEHHHPHVAARFFANLVTGSGPECAVSVATFLERLHELESGAYGEEGAAARGLLAARGLTAERIKEVGELVDTIASYDDEKEGPAGAPTTLEDRDEAEQALWSWYLEWSVIARAAIKEKRLLRALGFRRTRFGVEDPDVDLAPASPDAPQLPASTSGQAVPALPASVVVTPTVPA